MPTKVEKIHRNLFKAATYFNRFITLCAWSIGFTRRDLVAWYLYNAIHESWGHGTLET